MSSELPLIKLETEKLSYIRSLVNSIVIDKSIHCEIEENENLRFHSSNSSICAASVSLNKNLFTDFHFNANSQFKICSKSFMDSLNIIGFGNTNELSDSKFSLKAYSDTIKLESEKNGTKIECELRKMPNIGSETRLIGDVCVELMLSPLILKEIFQFHDIDQNSQLDIEIIKDESIIISTNGYGISSEIKIPINSDLIENFYSTESLKFSYQATFIKPVIKCANKAKKVSLKLDRNGFCSIQVLVYNQQDFDDCFIEYFIVPSC